MSRRKDRDRFMAMKRLNPDYQGFRGHREEPGRGNTPLQAVTCSRCGRTRNVPLGVALDQGNSYVCSRCREEEARPPEESSPGAPSI